MYNTPPKSRLLGLSVFLPGLFHLVSGLCSECVKDLGDRDDSLSGCVWKFTIVGGFLL